MRSIQTLFLLSILIFPFTLNSADIYVSSRGLVKIQANLNNEIVPGDPKLGSTIIIVTTPKTENTVGIDTACDHTEDFLYKDTSRSDRDLFVLRLSFPALCENPAIRVSMKGDVFTDTTTLLSMVSGNTLLRDLTDLSTDTLVTLMRNDAAATGTVANTSGQTLQSKLEQVHTLYNSSFSALQSNLVRSILNDRDGLTYISPVAGYSVPTKPNIIPGAGRPYRKDTTDGIHHGWDVLAPYGTPVRALAKGIVVRVKSDWRWADFDRIKHGVLSSDDKLTNLDIFRGNQIWFKTMDGNVTFYSHLSKIAQNITVGSVVDSGVMLGNIGTSGVPDRNYKDIHLHFEIQKNPHSSDEEPLNNLAIMRWDYVGKGEAPRQVVAEENKIFRTNSIVSAKDQSATQMRD